MSGIPTLKHTSTTLKDLRKHWFFLLAGIQSEPLAAAFIAPLVAFGPQWDTVDKQAVSLGDALLQSQATAVTADRVLNRLTDQVSAGIHEGKKPDLGLLLHQLYFGSAAPHEAKKPILGSQLAMMKPWPALLAKATQPALLALASAVTTGVSAADAADTKRKTAQSALDKFELDGELKQLFDTYNGLAATTFGGLKAIAHAHPELKLGQGWAESFFLHETRSEGPKTVRQAKIEVKRREKELGSAKQRLEELEQAQQAANEAKANEAKANEAVEAAKKEADAAKQKEKDAIEAAKRAKKAKKAKA